MRLFCACLATLVTLAAPLHSVRAVEKPAASLLSLYAGKYAGTLSYSGLSSGPATGVFKASATREKGSYNVTSNVSNLEGLSATISESFTFHDQKLVYSITISSLGSTISGSGVGKITVRKQNLNFKANIVLSAFGASAPATVTGFFLPQKKTMQVNTLVNFGGQSLSLFYQLQKKGKGK